MPGGPASLATDLPHQRLSLDHTQALAAAQGLLSGPWLRHGLCIRPTLILSVTVLQAPCSVPCVEERKAGEAKSGTYTDCTQKPSLAGRLWVPLPAHRWVACGGAPGPPGRGDPGRLRQRHRGWSSGPAWRSCVAFRPVHPDSARKGEQLHHLRDGAGLPAGRGLGQGSCPG